MTTQLDSIATWLGESPHKHSLEPPKIKKFSQCNSPSLFNAFSIPIKEVPSIPTANLEDNNTKKQKELFQKIVHAIEKLEKPTSSKQVFCIHKTSFNHQSEKLRSKANIFEKSTGVILIKLGLISYEAKNNP